MLVTRRILTLLVSATLLVTLAGMAALLPVPYVQYSPGPTYDTLSTMGGKPSAKPLIEIGGRRTYPTTGKIALTTVGVTKADQRLSLVEAIRGWLDPETAVVPRQYVYRDDVSDQQVQRRNAEEMRSSQDHATVAALRELKIPIAETVVVRSIVRGAPALGRLKAGDRILAIDSTPISTVPQVRKAISRHQPGQRVRFAVERAGRPVTTEVVVGADREQGNRPIVGILPAAGHRFPFQVRIQLDDVGGPSAGLMFALGLVDKLTPGALTGGASVAGTGEINEQGVVGPIGGITMKIIGARRDGATVFLVPKANCEDVVAVPSGIRLVRVDTLHSAVQALEALRTGRGQVPGCSPRR